jgi:RND family efflux transporter MFP subunit
MSGLSKHGVRSLMLGGFLLFTVSTAAEEPDLPCLIEPHRLVKLATPVAGVLSEVRVDRGDMVSEGMPVARLESGVEAAELEAAKVKAQDETGIQARDARRDYTELKRQRLEKLKGTTQYVSQTALDEAAADARQARAEAEAARVALRLSQIDAKRAAARIRQREIVSPLRGIVTERNLSPGEYAYEQAPVLTVAEMDPLNVELFLPFSRFGSVTPGQSMEIRPEPPVGGVYTATVTVIDKVMDARSGTFGVRLSLPNPDGRLPAGIRCTAWTRQ